MSNNDFTIPDNYTTYSVTAGIKPMSQQLSVSINDLLSIFVSEWLNEPSNSLIPRM